MSQHAIQHASGRRTLLRVSSEKGTMELAYEPVQHAVRVTLDGMRRLFFYEPDGFFPSKGTLLNEYGSAVGRLTGKTATTGFVSLQGFRFGFEIDTNQNVIVLKLANTNAPVTCSYTLEQATGQMPAKELLHALVAVLGWWHEPQFA